MARAAVFDPTDRELFDGQRQRFDWALLQTGFVFQYASRFHLDSACTRLADLGYLVHGFDVAEWTSVENMHTPFAASMSCPAYQGKNLDAFNDVLSDVATIAPARRSSRSVLHAVEAAGLRFEQMTAPSK